MEINIKVLVSCFLLLNLYDCKSNKKVGDNFDYVYKSIMDNWQLEVNENEFQLNSPHFRLHSRTNTCVKMVVFLGQIDKSNIESALLYSTVNSFFAINLEGLRCDELNNEDYIQVKSLDRSNVPNTLTLNALRYIGGLKWLFENDSKVIFEDEESKQCFSSSQKPKLIKAEVVTLEELQSSLITEDPDFFLEKNSLEAYKYVYKCKLSNDKKYYLDIYYTKSYHVNAKYKHLINVSSMESYLIDFRS